MSQKNSCCCKNEPMAVAVEDDDDTACPLKQAGLKTYFLQAVHSDFKAARDAAAATIQLYLAAPVGVGEHPGIVDELKKAFHQLVDAEDRMAAVEKKMAEYQ